MSRGYLVLAQNTPTDNYIRMAYALALSIKATQSTVNSVAIATCDKIPDEYKHAFDHIIDIPWFDHAEESKLKIENKWKYFHMTPFDETVVLDADMLFPADISHWWDIMCNKEIWITDSPQTFKGELITSTKYRECFVSNNLPNVYTAFMYFRKTEMTAELFGLVEIIFNNWKRFYYEYMDETRPKWLSGDVAYALAIKIMGIESECFGKISGMPTFVHMKSALQNIDEKYISEDWTKSIPTYFSEKGTFKIGNYEQNIPFHYATKSWLTNEMIEVLKDKVK